MKILNTIAAVALAVAITALSAFGEDEQLDTAPATAAAQAWLALVDEGRSGESWDAAATFFRDTVPKVKWQTAFDAAHAPLGIVLSRKMRSVTYARTLPNAPPGDYVVIEYDTRFENRPQAIETVTPVREKDGSWKVAGYFIR